MSFLISTGLPSWAAPAAIVHIALFLVLILPTWRGFAFARLGGPTALVLIVPGAGYLLVVLLMLVVALRRAGWPVISFLLMFVPVVNVLYMWMFGYGRWTTERERIRKRTAEAAARAAAEDDLAPSQRVLPSGDVGGMADADRADAATDAVPAADPVSATDVVPARGEDRSGREAAGGGDAAPAAEATETPPSQRPESRPDAISEATPEARSEPHFSQPPASAPPPKAPPETPPPAPPDEPPPPATPPAAPPASPAPPAAAPPAPSSEEDMTFVAGSGQPQEPTSWLIRGTDGRSQNFAMKLHEADLLDADNGILIGRSARADFIINDESVSRNHARLVLIKNRLCVEDLDSMNGTWIGGVRIESRSPVQLPAGTEFTIGKVNLRVEPAD